MYNNALLQNQNMTHELTGQIRRVVFPHVSPKLTQELTGQINLVKLTGQTGRARKLGDEMGATRAERRRETRLIGSNTINLASVPLAAGDVLTCARTRSRPPSRRNPHCDKLYSCTAKLKIENGVQLKLGNSKNRRGVILLAPPAGEGRRGQARGGQRGPSPSHV